MNTDLKPYCCQNATLRLLDHMIPIPEAFPVNPTCLQASGLDEKEFIQGLVQLTALLRALYEDQVENPKAYGLPLVEDIPYPKFNPKARDSMNASKRLSLLLMNLAHAATLEHSILTVNLEDFNARNKALKSKDKLANVPLLLGKMRDFGFVFDGFDGKRFTPGASHFTLHYPDSPLVLPTLKGYMASAHNNTALYALLYSQAMDPAKRPTDQCAQDFAWFLQGNDRAFFQALHPLLEKLGLFFRPSYGYAYVLVYQDPSKQGLTTDDGYYVRIFSSPEPHAQDRRFLALRLRAIANFTEQIEAMPARIQAHFTKSSCKHCTEVCPMRLQWTLHGQDYEGCSYWNHQLTDLEAQDAPYIAQLTQLEMSRAKPSRPRKTSK